MTQKEKLMHAVSTVRSVAARLRDDARCYDCKFPLPYAKTLEDTAEVCLKGLRK